VDAQTIAPLLDRNDLPAVAERAKSIRQAVSHMQTHLRSILNRLRPALLLDLGLAHAVDHLMAFWQARNRDVTFDVAISKESFGAALDPVAFRVIQEAVANAIRHGKPKRIEVRATEEANRMIITVRDDGDGVADGISKGFGLTGMRERISALGGTVTLSNRAGEKGVTVTVQIPVPKVPAGMAKAETQRGAAA
jgi:two-component system sensor histidine kinase UhpB